MNKIIFVCSGNTCRSPMAEGLAGRLLDCEVESYGMSVWGSSPASQNGVEVMRELGIDISAHVSRQLTKEIGDTADCIAAATPQIRDALTPIFGDKVCLLGNGISDPYGGDIEVYRKCRNEIFFAIVNGFMGVDIKYMNENDVAEIACLEKKCFASPWSEQSLSEEINNSDARFLTARSGGKLCGYIGMYNNSGEGYITNIAVDEDFRHRGIAKALIISEMIISSDENMEFISLEVRQSNTAAKNLYDKMGFVKVGERKGFYKDPPENGDIMTFYGKAQV